MGKVKKSIKIINSKEYSKITRGLVARSNGNKVERGTDIKGSLMIMNNSKARDSFMNQLGLMLGNSKMEKNTAMGSTILITNNA